MIKAKTNRIGCDIQIGGEQTTLLAELTAIITDFLEEGVADENLIDIAVGLAKAKVNGNIQEYMRKTLKETILNKIKEEKEEKEDADDLDNLLDSIKNIIKEALEDED